MSETILATIERARKKIDQLNDSSDQGDLVYRYAVAGGWLSALRAEMVIDSTTFQALTAELNAVFDERSVPFAFGESVTVPKH